MIPPPPLPCSFPPVVSTPTLHQSLSHHCPAHPPHLYSHTLDLWPLPCPPALSDRGTLLPHPPPSVGHQEVIVHLPSTSAHSQQYRLQDKWVVFNWKVEWPCSFFCFFCFFFDGTDTLSRKKSTDHSSRWSSIPVTCTHTHMQKKKFSGCPWMVELDW